MPGPFLRNIFSSIPKKNSKPFTEAVKAIFKFTDIELARTAKNALSELRISDQPQHVKAYEIWIIASKMPFNTRLSEIVIIG